LCTIISNNEWVDIFCEIINGGVICY